MSSQQKKEVVLGVDTHLDKHIGVVIDSVGKLLGHLSVSANATGYRQLVKWSQSFGGLQRAGVEGTGTYGAGLARYLAAKNIVVLDINQPDRSTQRFRSKSDPTDAESAARTVFYQVLTV